MKRNIIILVLFAFGVFALVLAGFLYLVFSGHSSSKSVPNKVSWAPPDPEVLSKPLDPWTVEPVAVESMYLVTPFVNEDSDITSDGFSFMFNVQDAMFAGMSRDKGLNRDVFTRSMLRRICDYSPDRSYHFTDQIRTDLITYMNPTHIVEGVYKTRDEQWIITVTVEAGSDHWEREFIVPQGHVVRAGRDIAVWMSECGAFPVEDKYKHLLNVNPYGTKVVDIKSDLYHAMCGDPHHDEWKVVFNEEGDNSLTRYFRLLAAINAKDDKVVDQLMPGPLDANGFVYDYMARIAAFNYYGNKSAAVHERKMLMALYPGWIDQAKLYIYETFPKSKKEKTFLHSVDQWHTRVSQYPDTDLMKADAYHNVAWDYRGDGWAHTVLDSHANKFAKYENIALKYYESCLSKTIPEPYLVGRLIQAGHTTGNGSTSANNLHRMVVGRYPDQRDTWRSILNFSRPRWGGSDQMAMKLIDDSMVYRPKNHTFGQNAIDYHELEAQLYSEDYSYFKSYCNQFPARKKQVMAAYERLRAKEAPDYLAAIAACVGTMLEDGQMVRQVVADHPDVFDSISTGRTYTTWYGRTRHRVIYSLITHGEWERAREALEVARKDDEYYRKHNKEHMLSFYDSWQYIDAYEVLVKAMLNGEEKDKAIKTIRGLPPRAARLTMIPYINAHYGEMEKKDYEDLLEYQKQYPNDPDPFYIRALAALKQGWNDSALHELKAASEKSGSAWVAVKNEVDELMKEKGLEVEGN